MRNHSGHELDVSIAVCLIDSEGPLIGRGLMDRLLIARINRRMNICAVVPAGRIRY
jgi:hypothetical protein